jgi:exopolyphosphatase/pppGpp-phosphohydrolase
MRRLAWLVAALWLGAAPARADLHGGIEIGAKGVKATVIDVTGGADGYDVKVLLAATQNTTLTAGLAASGQFDAKALKDTAAAVARFAAVMRKEQNVPTARIYVVGSSGLFSAIEDKPDAIKTNQESLARAVREAADFRMDFIDVRREVELSIAGIVPARYAGSAVLLDVGSGNTKGGYRQDRECVFVGIPYGSVTFADRVKKASPARTYAESADALREEILIPALKKELEGKAGLLERRRVYLSGGAVWALATIVRPGDRSNYTALTADDVATYRKMLGQGTGAYPTPDLSGITDLAVRRAAEREIAQVKKVYTPEQMLAGAEILQALATTFAFDKDKQVYFARNAQVGWILAYVAEKAGARQ